jgi:hypothetical protein
MLTDEETVTLAMDAFRLCIGKTPRNHTAVDVCRALGSQLVEVIDAQTEEIERLRAILASHPPASPEGSE